MSPLDLLIARVTRRRDSILRQMRQMDDDAEESGVGDTGGHLIPEVRLVDGRRHLAELRKLRRTTGILL